MPKRNSSSIIELIVGGHISSKKNNLRLSRGGRGYYDAETRANIDGITAQLSKQWRVRDKRTGEPTNTPLAPLAHPAIAVVFYVTTTNSDKDNKYTTLQDCLVDAGCLKGDSIADLNSNILIGQAIRTEGVAGARIFLETDGNFGRLYRYVTNQKLDDYEVIRIASANQQNRRFKRA